jgi:thioester reductase-like protein
VFFVGVGTAVTVARVGAVVSMTNVGTVNADEIFPAASVTVIVQVAYVPATNALNVTVLFPRIADVVVAEQAPPYVIVPASVEENV